MDLAQLSTYQRAIYNAYKHHTNVAIHWIALNVAGHAGHEWATQQRPPTCKELLASAQYIAARGIAVRSDIVPTLRSAIEDREYLARYYAGVSHQKDDAEMQISNDRHRKFNALLIKIYDILHDVHNRTVRPCRPAHLQAPPSNVKTDLDSLDDEVLEASVHVTSQAHTAMGDIELFLTDGEVISSDLRFTREIDTLRTIHKTFDDLYYRVKAKQTSVLQAMWLMPATVPYIASLMQRFKTVKASDFRDDVLQHLVVFTDFWAPRSMDKHLKTEWVSENIYKNASMVIEYCGANPLGLSDAMLKARQECIEDAIFQIRLAQMIDTQERVYRACTKAAKALGPRSLLQQTPAEIRPHLDVQNYRAHLRKSSNTRGAVKGYEPTRELYYGVAKAAFALDQNAIELRLALDNPQMSTPNPASILRARADASIHAKSSFLEQYNGVTEIVLADVALHSYSIYGINPASAAKDYIRTMHSFAQEALDSMCAAANHSEYCLEQDSRYETMMKVTRQIIGSPRTDLYANAPFLAASTICNVHDYVLLEVAGLMNNHGKFGGMLHLYNALVQLRLVDRIPILDIALVMFSNELFQSDRPPESEFQQAYYNFMTADLVPTRAKKADISVPDRFDFTKTTIVSAKCSEGDAKTHMRRVLMGPGTNADVNVKWKKVHINSKQSEFNFLLHELRVKSLDTFEGMTAIMRYNMHKIWIEVMNIYKALCSDASKAEQLELPALLVPIPTVHQSSTQFCIQAMLAEADEVHYRRRFDERYAAGNLLSLARDAFGKAAFANVNEYLWQTFNVDT